MTAIVVEQVDKSFGSRQVLHRLDFRIDPGEIVGLLGPNGSGKTTTLRLVAGFYQPDAGRVSIPALGNAPGHAIGYLPERAPLYDALSVDHYLQFVARCKRLRGKAARAAIENALQAFDLEGVRSSAIGRLSKGFRQRVGLAQAILGDPSVLLLDEATNGLDPMQIVEARQMIRKAARGRAVIFSSHLMQEVEALCTRVLILRAGELLADLPLDTDCHASRTSHILLRWQGVGEAALHALTAALGALDGVVEVTTDTRREPPGVHRLVVRHTNAPAHLDALLQLALAHGHVVEARPLSTNVEDLLVSTMRAAAARAR